MDAVQRVVVYLTLVAIVLLVLWVRDMHQKDERRKRHIANLMGLIDKMSRELDNRGVQTYWEADDDYAWLFMNGTQAEEETE